MTETRQPERPFDPGSDGPRGGAEYGALHAAHRLLNDRLPARPCRPTSSAR